MRALVALTLLAACHRDRPALTSCAESLGGLWRAPSGDWMLIDRGARIEGYPQFPDLGDGAAPASLALTRSEANVRGMVHRRFTRDANSCVANAAVRITSCSARTIDVVLSDPSAPISFSPCAFSERSNPSRRERWLRLR